MNSVNFVDWMTSGPLRGYVRSHRTAGNAISVFECAQPAGDMSDPPVDSLVLIQTLSPLIRHRSNFAHGTFTSADPAGTLYLVPPHVATQIEVFDPHAIRSIAFAVDRFSGAVEEYLPSAASFDFGPLHRGGFRSAEVSRLADRLWSDADEPGPANGLATHGVALQLIATFHRLAFAQPRPIRGGLPAWATARCIEYLRANLDKDVALDVLAGLVGLSPFHFSRMFKESTGLPPASFMRQMRCERAKDLLVTTDQPISAVAAAVGFATPQAFARMFADQTGVSPSQWRRGRGV